MTRKSRRPGTRGGREGLGETDPFERVKLPRPNPNPKSKTRLPSDIADAAEAALDDMLDSIPDPSEEDNDDESRTETRSPSHGDILEEEDSGEILVHGTGDSQVLTVARQNNVAPPARRSKIPLPAPPRTTSARTVEPQRPSSLPPPRPSPIPLPRGAPSTRPSRPSAPPTRVVVDRARSSGGADSPLPSLPRPRTSSTLSDMPRTRAEVTTLGGDSSRDVTDAPTRSIEQTNRVPEELIVDVQSAPVEMPVDFGDDAVEIEARPELTELQVVVWEDGAQLAIAQSAVAAAGHFVNVGASGREGATRAIRAIRGGGIDVVVAALPGGESVIDAALALEPRRPVIIASLAGSMHDAVARSHAAGADLVLTRPHDVERIAPVLLAASRLCFEKRLVIAARGAEQLLRARYDEIVDAEPGGLLPFEMFQRVLELEIKRAKRYEYPLSVALFVVEVEPPAPPSGIAGILRARAGNALINTIRDIDIATQVDHERFLVLLPYTDLKGAANLGRRVITSVAALDPVIAGGRNFPPRVTGAVAGGAPGQPLSFAKLMKEATRALEQARRDGAELAVQP
jgi:hypothetical protein